MVGRITFAQRYPRLATILSYLPPQNFITLHYLYFVTVCLISSAVFYGSSRPSQSISYVDSLFLVVSAMTETGLNTVNLSEMTTWQQVILWLLICMGGQIWVSIWTVLARKRHFEKQFEDIARRATLRSPRSTERHRSVTDIPLARQVMSFSRSKTLLASSDAANELDARHSGSQGRTARSSEGPFISSPIAARRLWEPISKSNDQIGETDNSTTLEPPLPGETVVRDHVTFADAEDQHPRATTTGVDLGNGLSRRNITSADDTDLEGGRLRHQISHRQFLTSEKIGRNAQFHGLTAEQRENLGGTEYRALKVLSIAVPFYFFSWQILGNIALGAWIANNQPQFARDNGINPWWNGIFNGASAFNNSGMSVLDANMIPYGSSYFVLFVMGVMILAGNTAYPVFLRFWLWSILKLLNLLTYENSYGDLKETLEYILKYPRRVYTNLFPSRATWWLLFMLFVLNGTDWIAFEVLNLGNPNLGHISVGSKVMDGLFQAIAVRSGGFYVVSISTLYIGLQVLYVIMMYISVYPVVITMRHSNVYEERSLGIYHNDNDAASFTSTPSNTPSRDANANRISLIRRFVHNVAGRFDGVGAAPRTAAGDPESRSSFIGHQVRGQLSHDMWLLVLAVLVISTIETRHFLEDPMTFSVFNIIFEVVSAYGCVGISVGVPYDAFSLSGGLYTGSKLILCFVMLRGRHRGLPVALDRAVRLPGEEFGRTEEEDHRIRRSMSTRRQSIGDA